MSLWEFAAAVGGYIVANSTEDRLTSEQAERLAAWIDQPPVWH